MSPTSSDEKSTPSRISALASRANQFEMYKLSYFLVKILLIASILSTS
tara:strand:- start:235 stop:378 length:144 start_codon:yes stop_codon:yes gene_type:complete